MRRQTESRHRAAVLSVLADLRRHLDTTPTLRTLAAGAGFSPFHFARLFRALTGESIAAHVRRLRLERAALGLGRGDTVTVAAFAAGYESVEAFSRAFRSAYGVPPSRFAGDPALPAPCGIHYTETADGEPLPSLPSLLPPAAAPALDVTLAVLPPRPLAAIRLVGPYPGLAGAFGRLGRWARGRPDIPGRAWQVALTHDDPAVTPPDRLRSDACIEVVGGFSGDRVARPARLLGGRYARYRHRGPYEGIGGAWDRLIRDWMVSAGLCSDDRPCVDHYLNDPDDVPSHALVTDLYLPLADGV